MNPLAHAAERLPGAPFQWRSADGSRHVPAEMLSRHLFHTVVMIWNHGMPPDAATHDYVRHRFNPETHGPEYLRLAVAMMLPELLTRRDLAPWMLARLAFMQAYLVRNPAVLPAPLLQIEHRP